MSEDCHDSNNLSCDYCGEVGHDISTCPDFQTWCEYEDEQDMIAEAAHYQDPRWKEILGE